MGVNTTKFFYKPSPIIGIEIVSETKWLNSDLAFSFSKSVTAKNKHHTFSPRRPGHYAKFTPTIFDTVVDVARTIFASRNFSEAMYSFTFYHSKVLKISGKSHFRS